jgi:hypothetical protein
MLSRMTPLARALATIDAVHDEDPCRLDDGHGRERLYAERMTHWLEKLAPDASDALKLAVRAQHLARWRSPRDAFPEGRVGYLQWRKAAGQKHADDVRAILESAGFDIALVDRVAALVTKKDRTRDPESQLLEDCACLVFLELDYAAFAEKHDDTKVIDIVKKTWAKMSPRAHDEALAMALSGRAAALIETALRP